jgi:hypothetical protein
MCLSSREEKQASDARRERVAQIQILLRHESTSYEDINGLADELIQLARTEGLTTKLSDFAFTVATAYFKRGDLVSAERYAEVALRHLQAFGDQNNQQVTDMRKNVDWLKGLRVSKGKQKRESWTEKAKVGLYILLCWGHLALATQLQLQGALRYTGVEQGEHRVAREANQSMDLIYLCSPA